MSGKTALIVVKLGHPNRDESEWNVWYDNKHIADRLAIPGFLSARRFTKIDGPTEGFAIPGEPKYLTLYDLANTDVLRAEQYLELKEKESSQPADSFEAFTLRLPKFTRGVYEQIYPPAGVYTPPQTKFVFLVGHEVPQNRREEFNAWYNTEHIPAMLRVPGFLTSRRFIIAKEEFPPVISEGGTLPTYLSVYDIEDINVFKSKAFLKERESPWSTWVRSWFTRKMRAVYHRIYPYN